MGRSGSSPDPNGDDTPLRFTDVIGELHQIAMLACQVDGAGGVELVAACRRAESLLARLRNQFLEDLLSGEGLAPVSAA